MKNNSEPIELNEFNSRIKKGGWSEIHPSLLHARKSFAHRERPSDAERKGGGEKRGEKEKERGKPLLPVSTIRGIKGVPIARVLIKE